MGLQEGHQVGRDKLVKLKEYEKKNLTPKKDLKNVKKNSKKVTDLRGTPRGA